MLFLLFCSSVFCSSGVATCPEVAPGAQMQEPPAKGGDFALLSAMIPAWVLDIISSEQKLLAFKPNFMGVSQEDRREIAMLATIATSSLLGEYVRRCTSRQTPAIV